MTKSDKIAAKLDALEKDLKWAGDPDETCSTMVVTIDDYRALVAVARAAASDEQALRWAINLQDALCKLAEKP